MGLRQNFEELLHRSMSRKQFLVTLAIGAVAAVGLSGLLSLFKHQRPGGSSVDKYGAV